MYTTQAIGPWSGGLNLSSNRDLSLFLKPNELGIGVNVQLTPEGFIESRPGFKVLDHSINDGFEYEVSILGTLFIVNQFVTVVQVVTDLAVDIYYVTGDKQANLKCSFDLSERFSSVVALNNSAATLSTQVPRGIFLFSSTAVDKCYRIEEAPSINASVTPVLMSSALKVPRSHFSFSVKDRIFLIDSLTSTIYWSGIGINSLFFNVNEVDGSSVPTARALETGFESLEPSIDQSDNLVSVEFLNNSFYLFKKASSYIFTYQADPEKDGYLRKFNRELGAFDSTIYRNTVLVINNRGVFTVEGTEFIDIQQKLNLRFETNLDNLSSGQAFITEYNDNVLIGFRSATADPYYYLLNGDNKGWTQWDFSYADEPLASPGSNGYFTQDGTGAGIILFTTMDRSKLIYSEWKPSENIHDYALDSGLVTDSTALEVVRFIPNIDIQSRVMVGDSVLNYKKVYRSYVRLYISDVESLVGAQVWRFSLNYNDYYMVATNPAFLLEPAQDTVGMPSTPPQIAFEPIAPEVETVLYRRTYQIPMPQHRVKEFAFQLTRTYSKVTDKVLVNPSTDRPVQQGFYFLLSGFWVDYRDTQRI